MAEFGESTIKAPTASSKPSKVESRITEIAGERVYYDKLPKNKNEVEKLVQEGISILLCIAPMEDDLEIYANKQATPDGKTVQVINVRDHRLDPEDPADIDRIAFEVFVEAKKTGQGVALLFHDYDLPLMLVEKYRVANGGWAERFSAVNDERSIHTDLLKRVNKFGTTIFDARLKV